MLWRGRDAAAMANRGGAKNGGMRGLDLEMAESTRRARPDSTREKRGEWTQRRPEGEREMGLGFGESRLMGVFIPPGHEPLAGRPFRRAVFGPARHAATAAHAQHA